jgi:hypothetical protein
VPVSRATPTNRVWLALASVIICYLIVAAPFLSRPALYLDAVNPDYFAIKILHPSIPNTLWVLPGNLIEDRFPVLANSIYFGSLQAYLAVPFTWLMGPTVLTVRILHICEAILVCIAAFALIRRVGGSTVLAAIGALLLAVDPGFVFAFRTQAYVTTFPIFFTLCGCILLTGPKPGILGHVAAGTLFGLAAWGYFVHLFVLPGVGLFLLTRPLGHGPSRLRLLAACGIGLVIGTLPYVLGYALIVHALGGVSEAIAWFGGVVGDLHIDTKETLPERAATVLSFAAVALTGDWVWRVVWGVYNVDYGQIAKLCVLLAAPIVGFGLAVRGSFIRTGGSLVLYTIISYVAVAIAFGGRLGGHHFVLLLPLLYVLFALSLGMILEADAILWRRRVLAGVGIALLAANLSGDLLTLRQLRTVEGAAFYSDPVVAYPLAALASGDTTPHVFMDWGGLMQFTYLTGGRIPAYGRDEITGYGRVSLVEPLCHLGIRKLVFLGPGAAARGQAEIERLHLTTLDTHVLRDHTGRFEYSIVTVAPPTGRCGSPRSG